MKERKTLNQWRIERNLGIREFARLVGVDPSAMHGWLSGKHTPLLSTLDKLCEALGVSRDAVEV